MADNKQPVWSTFADVNNYIGQKLFTYIYDGKQIGSRIKEKFKKSLIFIGYEGQIYNPLTNTYIGIGKTAYTNTSTWIQEAHDKIDALNTALTSSLVSGIWANWGEDDWNKVLGGDHGTDGFTRGDWHEGSDGVPTLDDFNRIYATNDVVFKGVGDYDPDTQLAYTKEYVHITDTNYVDKDGNFVSAKEAHSKYEGQTLYNALTYSYFTVSGERSKFATSGITVSLTKGLNRYGYSFIVDYVDDEGKPQQSTYKIYINDEDKEDLAKKISGGGAANWNLFDQTYSALVDSEGNAIFKQGKNLMTIDDRLTWSYIANAYSYTLNFARDYTNYQVNRVYREILGESEATMIPVSTKQVKQQIVNGEAKITATGEDNDLLYSFILNNQTVYFERITLDNSSKYSPSTGIPKYAHVWGSSNWEGMDKPGDGINGDSGLNYYDPNENPGFVDQSQKPTKDEQINFIQKVKLTSAGNEVELRTWDAMVDIFVDHMKGVIPDADFLKREKMTTDGTNTGTPLTFESYDEYVEYAKEHYKDTYFMANDIDGYVYSLDYVYKPIGLESDLQRYIEGENEGIDFWLYIINKEAIHNSEINLSDGIQTLKEVAYILDIITDGLGIYSDKDGMNPEDAENNGIQLAYNIAYQNIWNAIQDERLSVIESGFNVVSSMNTKQTHRYIETRWESNKVWIPKNVNSYVKWSDITEVNDGTTKDIIKPFPLEETFFVKLTSDSAGAARYIELLDSVLSAYNTAISTYIYDVAKVEHLLKTSSEDVHIDPIEQPVLYDYIKDYLPYYAQEDYVQTTIDPDDPNILGEEKYSPDLEYLYYVPLEMYNNSHNGNEKDENYGMAYSYVGNVTLSIDLDVATTYEIHDFSHFDNEGFVPIEWTQLNSTKKILATLPGKITFADGLEFAENSSNIRDSRDLDSVENDLRYETRKYSIGTQFDSPEDAELKNRDKITLGRLIAGYGESIETCDWPVEIELCNPNVNSSSFDIEFTIPATGQSNSPYDGKLYLKTWTTYSVTTGQVVEDVDDMDSDEYELRFSYTPVTSDLNILSKDLDFNEFYVRYLPTSGLVTHAYTLDAGLADVNWTMTYVKDVVSDMKVLMKEHLLMSYKYTTRAIDRLDSSYSAGPSQFIQTVIQENGLITAETKELPSDYAMTSYSFWGEDTNISTLKTFSEVNLDEITENEITQDTPLFVNYGDTFIEIEPNEVNDVIEYDGTVVSQIGKFMLITGDYTFEDLSKADLNELKYRIIYIFDSATGKYSEMTEKDKYAVVNSIRGGKKAANYVPCFIKHLFYTRIDPADLKFNDGAWTYTIAGVDTPFTKFYKSDDNSSKDVVKYITSTSYHHTAEYGGVGGNTIHIQANLTRIADASKTNSGLVDAYDVRTTLDNLFEWVDLSHWDEDNENPMNNSESLEDPSDSQGYPYLFDDNDIITGTTNPAGDIDDNVGKKYDRTTKTFKEV